MTPHQRSPFPSPAPLDPSPPPPPTGLFNNLSREHGFELVPFHGTLPPGLEGTLFRNGAGLLEQFGRRYDHVFESDGAISALRLSGGQAQAAVRVIRSEGLLEEQAAGRHLASFAARWPTRVRRLHGRGLKNTANTHVVPWQGGLYALMEGDRPTRIDPKSLRTQGESDLGGVVTRAFSAHPHRVAEHQALYNFGFVPGRQPHLELMTLPDHGPARRLGQVRLDHAVMLHDFIATPRHLVFFVAPIRVVLWRMLLGIRSFTDNLRWHPEDGTEIIVVPLDTPNRPTRFRVDPFSCFHFAGAFETPEHIVVDYVRYPDSGMLGALGDGLGLTWTDRSKHAHGVLHRARIDVKRQSFTSAPLWDGSCEYPRLAPHEEGTRNRQLWLQSTRYVDGALRFAVTRADLDDDRARMQHHVLDPGHLSSESVFAPDPRGEPGQGSVLTLVFDSFTQRSHVLVLDAQTLEYQARIQLAQAIPLTFHGSWLPTTG